MNAHGTHPRICLACGLNFLACAKSKGYCSRFCAARALRAVPRASCPCEVCGKIRLVTLSEVAKGHGKYCSDTCRNSGITIHGESSQKSKSPEYMAWKSIKTRCLNPKAKNYANYGGRGITICDSWRDSFPAFLSDVGRRPSPQHSIDRKDNVNGHYEPGNVRWATAMEQANNRRNNRLITFRGVTQCASVWARMIGVSQGCMSRRLKLWDLERALTTPNREKTQPKHDETPLFP